MGNRARVNTPNIEITWIGGDKPRIVMTKYNLVQIIAVMFPNCDGMGLKHAQQIYINTLTTLIIMWIAVTDMICSNATR